MKQKIIIGFTAFVSAASQIAVPFAVSEAYVERGYFAIGGEYGLIVLSLICMFMCINQVVQMYETNSRIQKLHITYNGVGEDEKE